MQLTPAAFALIDDLRTNDHVRSHFNMMNWLSTCGTVGCIAGTAVMRYGNKEQKKFISKQLGQTPWLARGILGIDDFNVSSELFEPWQWVNHVREKFPHLTGNERPPQDHVEEMKRWAQSLNEEHPERGPTGLAGIDFGSAVYLGGYFGPDAAANALERLQDHETYVDWAEAHRLLETA